MTTAQRNVARMVASYSRRAQEIWARARGLDPDRLRGPALQTELARVLLSSTALKGALAEATADEKTALARIHLAGGQITAEELKAQLTVDGVKNADATLTSLMSRGLLFYERTMEGYSRWELWGGAKAQIMPRLWLPREVSELVTIPADLGHLPLEPAPAPENVREMPYTLLQRDLYLLLQSLRENPVKLLKSGDVGKRDSERLLQILPTTGAGENDPTAKARAEGVWFQFLWMLIQRAGFLETEPGRITVSEAGRQFLGQSEAQQAHRLLRAWVNLMEWDEFRRVPSLELEPSGFGDFPLPPQLVMARLTLMELLLRQRPYPGWYSLPSLLRSVQRFNVAFLIPRSNTNHLWPWRAGGATEDRHYRGIHARGISPWRYFDKDEDWMEVEGAFLRTLLEEPLLWLGIVRLGYAEGQPACFELTERGAAAVGLIEASAAPPPLPGEGVGEKGPEQRALVVQPNFEVVVYQEVAGIALLIELDRFAERVRMDRAALYRLTRADLCRGLQSGLPLDQIVRILENHNAGPLPQNVAYTLAEWEHLFNRIHVRRAVSLIEAADDAELQALRALPELKDAVEVAPRVLLVRSAPAVRSLPRKPEVIDYAAPITQAIEFETATRLRILQPTPRLLHRLLQLAEPVGEGKQHGDTETRRTGKRRRGEEEKRGAEASAGSSLSSQFELSREKVASAARWWPWTAMHAFLVGAARSKPPGELAVILKGWAGELAPAALTSVTLLTAPSAEWLDQVMLVPAVKRAVRHRLSPTLALVSEADRSRLQEALAAVGVSAGAGGSVDDLLAAASKADSEAGEILLIGPPRKRRALIERAIAERKKVVIAEMPYSGKLSSIRLEPLRIEGEGAGACLVARVEGHRYEYRYGLNRIQGVRMLDEPVSP